MDKLYTIEYNNEKVVCSSELILNSSEIVVIKINKYQQLGTVIRPCIKSIDLSSSNIVVRIASKKDISKFEENKIIEKKIYEFSRNLSTKMDLKLTVVSANYSLKRDQLLIKFVADVRIDFREYAKKLAQHYKTRIELRQIGARDRSKFSKTLGSCGQKLCCERYLENLDTVSIGMAKNQSLTLNPTKTNGCCGRLKCCLAYENDLYKISKENLPEVGDKIKYEDKEYIIRSIDILLRKIYIFKDKEKIELDADEYYKK